ncbi:MAG: tRNA pseudouridine(54/55) synthase Pus10, partial [Methanophagales archaeon]|nr:tRNA pseudouridine(54/55) synthase Pus10 [Methanophagales archaeon]
MSVENFGELREDTVIEIAREIIKEGSGPICDNCLGRQFAKISSGLSNDKRGKILKEVLRTKWKGEEIEEGKCWVCNGLFENLETWVSKALEKLKEYELDSFLVGTKVSGMLLENEELIWEIAGASYAEPLKAELNREVGKRIEHETGKIADFERPDLVVILNLWTEKVELQVNSVFIYGKYRKFKRGIPQTRWFCRECRGRGCEKCNFTGKMYAESVEELISGSILAEFKGEDMVLQGCGREDIDARMLGSGRPFVVEIKEPRQRKVDLRMLE